MADTSIEWTNKTWNPVTGCTKVSPGCSRCYAARMAHRLAGRFGYPPAPHEFDVVAHIDKMAEPLHWKKPAMIFVDSMGDLFHKDVPDKVIMSVFAIMGEAYWHTFQVLTKRPERMHAFIQGWLHGRRRTEPLGNVWLGVSAENQACADERIPLLLQTPAAVRFVSVEPMLGPVSLTVNPHWLTCHNCRGNTHFAGCTEKWRSTINWVICGGESGQKARPIHPDWVRSLRDQCQAAGASFFFKQWGEWAPGERGRLYHEQTIDWTDGQPMVRVGKGCAGKILDGRVWDQMPEARNGK